MSNFLADCTMDEGLDYIFGRMGATYGAAFMRHWDGIAPELVRDVWKDDIGVYLTSKESMDYALKRMNANFPPSSIAFRDLCIGGPPMKRAPVIMIEKQLTEAEKQKVARDKADAMQKLQALRKSFGQG